MSVALVIAAVVSALGTCVVAWYARRSWSLQREVLNLQREFNDWVKSEAQPVPHVVDCYPTLARKPPRLKTQLRVENPGKNTIFVRYIRVDEWEGVPKDALLAANAYPKPRVHPSVPGGPAEELSDGAVPPRGIRDLYFELRIIDVDCASRGVQGGGDLYFRVTYVSGGKEGSIKIGPYKAL
ncbi:MAG TPA: hypothetical protein ENN53_04145 [Candidatus Acetothermia bacterium]|nr:hypothetical protein [Candidatus Acetothermia bacterium]